MSEETLSAACQVSQEVRGYIPDDDVWERLYYKLVPDLFSILSDGEWHVVRVSRRIDSQNLNLDLPSRIDDFKVVIEYRPVHYRDVEIVRYVEIPTPEYLWYEWQCLVSWFRKVRTRWNVFVGGILAGGEDTGGGTSEHQETG